MHRIMSRFGRILPSILETTSSMADVAPYCHQTVSTHKSNRYLMSHCRRTFAGILSDAELARVVIVACPIIILKQPLPVILLAKRCRQEEN